MHLQHCEIVGIRYQSMTAMGHECYISLEYKVITHIPNIVLNHILLALLVTAKVILLRSVH